MPNRGDRFEGYVQFVYQTLLGAQGKNISVSRRATVYDNRGNPYNIDVFYEFDVAGVHHRVAIECKDTRRPVERDEAITFVGKIRDMPSTIGIFISNGGFQSAAKKYLKDHGVLHYDGGDLPHFGSVLASMISPIVLPNESAVGQPFWTLMEFEKGSVTGAWCLVRHPGNQAVSVFPLFYSKQHAKLFHQLEYNGSPSVCVRGIEQPALRFLILCAHRESRSFAILQPFNEDNRQKFTFEELAAQILAREYLIDDLTHLFEKL